MIPELKRAQALTGNARPVFLLCLSTLAQTRTSGWGLAEALMHGGYAKPTTKAVSRWRSDSVQYM
jgi:hypothetical protein